MRPSTSPSSPCCAALLACGALVAAALAIGCRSGPDGDPPAVVVPSEFGQGRRLCDIAADPGTHPLGPCTWEVTDGGPNSCVSLGSANCGACADSPPETAVVTSGLTVIAIDNFDETMDGKSRGNIYLEDTRCDGKPYAGIQAFGAGFAPPDLRLAVGDVVDVNGDTEEFRGPTSKPNELFSDCRSLPEFTGTLIFRFDSLGPTEPVDIELSDLVGYDNGRRYLGMLVRVKKVTLSAAGANSEGRYTAPFAISAPSVEDVPKIDNELYDLQGQGPALNADETFASVTGIVTYFYNFNIAPRSRDDIVLETADAGADGGM